MASYSCKVIKTTDGKHRGLIFNVPDLDLSKVGIYTGGKFKFDTLKWIDGNTVKLSNSNYSAIIRVSEVG